MQNNIQSINENDLITAVRLLQALRDPTRPDHTSALRSLENNVLQSGFILHILHIFAAGGSYDPSTSGITTDIRQLAGLIIKNYVFPHLNQLPHDLQQLIKADLLNILHDPVSDLRKTAAILIGKISETFMVHFWSDLLPPILDSLTYERYRQQFPSFDGCLHAINRICEDSSVKLSLDDKQRPLDLLIPRLLALLSQVNDNSAVRVRVLESYNCLLYLLEGPSSISVGGLRSRNTSYDSNVDTNSVSSTSVGTHNRNNLSSPLNLANPNPNGIGNTGNGLNGVAASASPLILNMKTFIETLAILANDPNPPVRKAICQSLTIIACLQVSLLEGYFSNICEFMIASLMDGNEEVAMESCEYWNALLQSPDTKRAILPYLKRLVEGLITRLYLTAEQMEAERTEEEEEESGEKALNIQPLFHRLPSYSSSGKGGGGGGSSSSEMKENNELSSKWTLRKQAALTLDVIAMSFPPREILSAALPKIQQCFEDNSNVLVKESGMLALGALSSGCLEEMAMFIPQLFPFILNNLKDDLPEMRSISCWVLSRYCRLFGDRSVHNTFSEEAGQQFFQLSLQELVHRMVFDQKSRVQIAACSALVLLIEASFPIPTADSGGGGQGGEQNILIPSLESLLSAVSRALDSYGVKASLILIDLLGAIADTLGAAIAPFTGLFFPKLFQKLMSLDQFDSRLFPILECLTSVLAVIGLEAQQFLPAIYQRCLQILVQVLLILPHHHNKETGVIHGLGLSSSSLLQMSHSHSPSHDESTSKDFAVCAMDVISAISEGIGPHFIALISSTPLENNPNPINPNGTTNPTDINPNGGSVDLLMQLMLIGLRENELAELRQSSFSLAGEICKHSFAIIANHSQRDVLLNEILSLSAANLDTSYPLVCNNAAWTIGEISNHLTSNELYPFLSDMMNGLIFALQTSDLHDNFKVNVAIALGRIAVKCPLEVSELADEFFAAWCSVLSFPCPHLEKCQAFFGLLAILHHYPDLVLGNKTNIYSLLIAAVSWTDFLPPQEILSGLSAVFHHIAQMDNQLWSKVLKTFSNSYSLDYLQQLYSL